MKKIFYLVTLVTLFALGTIVSCSKFKQQMDDIEKHVDIIESTRIAPLEEQVKSIMGSIGDLKNLKATLDKVEADLTAKGKDITALKEARTSIEKRIGELETYVENLEKEIESKLGKYAEKEWVEKTFATKEELEKTYNELADLIAFISGGASMQLDSLKDAVSALDKRADGLDSRIDSLDKALKKELSDAIGRCENGLKDWVATQLRGYYTIAQTESLLAAIREDLDSTDNAINNTIRDTAAALNFRLDSTSAKLHKDISDLASEMEVLTAGLIHYMDSSSASINDRVDSTASSINHKVDSIASRLGFKVDSTGSSFNFRIDTAYTKLCEKIKALDGMSQKHISNMRDSINMILDSLGRVNGKVEALNISVKESLDSIDRAKKAVTAEYKKAIEDAISANDGFVTTVIKNKFDAIDGEISDIKNNYNGLASRVSTVESQITSINSSISSINTSISTLTTDVGSLKTSVGTLQTDVAGLKTDVSKLKSRIQSVIFVPEYSGGVAYASYVQEKGPKTKEYKDLNLSFRVTPAAGAKKLTKENVCLDYRQVKTKADASKLSVSSVVVTSEAEGIVKVTVPASEMNRIKSYFEGNYCLACCLIVKTDDEDNLTSNYFDVKAEEYIKVDGVTLDVPAGEKTINIDGYLELNQYLKITPESASDKSVTWSSNKPSIATVGENSGIVTPVSVGDVTITATSVDNPEKKASVTLKIKADVSQIVLDKESLALVNVDDVSKNTGVVTVSKILPEAATTRAIEKWDVINSTPADVVKIEKISDDKMSCKVKAMKKGTATLRAKAQGFEVYAECTITVTDVLVESITLDKESVILTASKPESDDGKATINVSTVLPDDASDKTVTWTVDNADVVKIESQDGTKANIKALKEGTATLTATANDVSRVKATCTVNVTEVKVTGITLGFSSKDIVKGNEADLPSVTIEPLNAYNKNVEWSSSDNTIAKVDGNKIKALAVGTATLTATSARKDSIVTATCTINVTPIVATEITLDKTVITLQGPDATNGVIVKYNIKPDNVESKEVEIEIKNTDIAEYTVDKAKQEIKVKKKANGLTKMVVKTKDGSNKSAECEINIPSLEAEGPKDINVKKNGKTGEAKVKSAADHWEIADETVATITKISEDKKVCTVTSVAQKEGPKTTLKAFAADGSYVEFKINITNN